VQGDREREVIPPFQEFVYVLLAVEAPVQDVVEALDLEHLEGLKQIVHRVDVGDVAGDAVVIGRYPALLAEEHREVQLWQPLPVAGVAEADVLVKLAVGRDARDVVAEEFILEDLVHPSRQEGLLAVGRDSPEDLADALALQRLPRWVLMRLGPGHALAQGATVGGQVVRHGQYLPMELGEGRFQDLGEAQTLRQGVQDERWSDDGYRRDR
jgi:hypothetical protein